MGSRLVAWVGVGVVLVVGWLLFGSSETPPPPMTPVEEGVARRPPGVAPASADGPCRIARSPGEVSSSTERDGIDEVELVEVRGWVIDEAGRGIPGVPVRVTTPRKHAYGSEPPPNAVTDTDGLFVIERRSKARWLSLVAKRDGYLPAVVELGDVDGEAILILRRGAVLFGRVVDEAGVPVGAATLTLPRTSDALVRSELDGTYRLPPIAVGEVTPIAIRPPHGVMSLVDVRPTSAGEVCRDLVIPAAPLFRGRAYDSSTGAPLSEGVVAIRDDRYSELVDNTAPDGTFSFRRPGGTIRDFGVAVVAKGFVDTTRWFSPLETEDARSETFPFPMIAGATIRCRLIDDGDGAPRPRVPVPVWVERVAAAGSAIATVDGIDVSLGAVGTPAGRIVDGLRVFPSLDPHASYRLVAIYRKREVRSEPVSFTRAGETREVDLRLPSSSTSITGRVLVDDVPTSGVIVEWSGAGGRGTARTGPDGVYRFDDVDAEVVAVSARTLRPILRAVRTVDVAREVDTRCDFGLRVDPAIIGGVVHEAAGGIVAAVEVTATTVDGQRFSARTDGSGAFRIPIPPAHREAEFTVRAQGPSWQVGRSGVLAGSSGVVLTRR